MRPRPARKRGQARPQAERVARRERRRGERVALRHDDARRASRATPLEARNTSGRGCMVHGACAERMPRERSKPRHAPSPYPKGTEGIACPQMWTSCRNTRSLSERSTALNASSARGAKARGQGCHPQEGSQRASLSECGTKVPREFWRAPQPPRCPRRLFLSPSAFFEPAKKVRKNSTSQRPVAVSRDTSPQKVSASNASRVPQQNEIAYYRPLVYPAVGHKDLTCLASPSRRRFRIAGSRAKTARAKARRILTSCSARRRCVVPWGRWSGFGR